ncbi:MAG: hypothetical protein KBS85_05260 [Lachnospiraceae bacterium]|nr:hypothetical protein [Candidatus Merdinaster equi]
MVKNSNKLIFSVIVSVLALLSGISLGSAKAYAKGNIVDTADAIYTYDEMVTDIALLTKNYPEMCSGEVIGQSVDGRNIYAVTVGPKDAPASIFVESGTHAREYINCMLTMYQIEDYLGHLDQVYMAGKTYREILTNCNLVFVPMTNPDGVTISQFGIDAMNTPSVREFLHTISKSKNTRSWKSNARGVDLNRNYGCYFGAVQTSTSPSDAGFVGYKADSEPEVIAIEKLINSKDNWVAAVCFHSAESAVFYNVGDAASKEVLEKSLSMARMAVSMNGYNLYMDSRGYSQPRGLLYHWLLINKSLPTILIETCKGPSPQDYGEWAGLVRKNGNIPIQFAYVYGGNSQLRKAVVNTRCSVWTSANSKDASCRVKYLEEGSKVEIFASKITGVDGKEYYQTKKGNYILAKAITF